MEKFNTGDKVIVTYNGLRGTIDKVLNNGYYLVRANRNTYVYNGLDLKHDNRSMIASSAVSLLVGFQTFVIFAMNDLDFAGMVGGLAMYVTSFMVLKRR